MSGTGFRVEHDKKGRVARVVLAAPPLNVLTTRLARALTQVLADLAARPEHRVLAIASEGKAFSAGASIDEHVAREDAVAMLEAMHGLIRAIEDHPRPVVALVRGACLGGGLEVALACDLIWASERAAFGCPEIKLAVLAPFAAALLPRRVGFGQGLELLLSGEAVSAARALEIRLVERVFVDERFEQEGGALLARLAERSGPALGIARRAVREALGKPDLESALAAMGERYRTDVLGLSDAGEGLAAFLEKRPAVFQDRIDE